MAEARNKRHAGPFNAGHKRKPTPNDRDLQKEYLNDWHGWDDDVTCPHCGRAGRSRTTECRDGHPLKPEAGELVTWAPDPMNHSKDSRDCCPREED